MPGTQNRHSTNGATITVIIPFRRITILRYYWPFSLQWIWISVKLLKTVFERERYGEACASEEGIERRKGQLNVQGKGLHSGCALQAIFRLKSFIWVVATNFSCLCHHSYWTVTGKPALTSLGRIHQLLRFKAKVCVFWPVLDVLISLVGHFLFKEWSWRTFRQKHQTKVTRYYCLLLH